MSEKIVAFLKVARPNETQWLLEVVDTNKGISMLGHQDGKTDIPWGLIIRAATLDEMLELMEKTADSLQNGGVKVEVQG